MAKGHPAKGLTIQSFEKLLSKASSLQEEVKHMGDLEKTEKPRPVKTFEKKSGTVATVDKGKQPMQIQTEPTPQYNSRHPPQYSQHPQQHSQQYGQPYSQPSQPSFQQRPYRADGGQGPSMSERLNRVYSFKDEAVAQRCSGT